MCSAENILEFQTSYHQPLNIDLIEYIERLITVFNLSHSFYLEVHYIGLILLSAPAHGHWITSVLGLLI